MNPIKLVAATFILGAVYSGLPATAEAAESAPAAQNRRARLDFLASGVEELCEVAETWRVARNPIVNSNGPIDTTEGSERRLARAAVEDADMFGSGSSTEQFEFRGRVNHLRQICRPLLSRLQGLLRNEEALAQLSGPVWEALSSDLDSAVLRFSGTNSEYPEQSDPPRPCYKNDFRGAPVLHASDGAPYTPIAYLVMGSRTDPANPRADYTNLGIPPLLDGASEALRHH